MKKYFLAALCVAAFASGSASAAGVLFEANLVSVDEVTGGEVGVGTKLQAGKFALRPQIGFFAYPGEENTRYRSQTQKNGTEICRDMSNGQYSSKSNCGSNTDAAGFIKLEATYQFGGFELGVAGRYGRTDTGTTKSRGYATFSKAISPAMSWKVNAGQKYVALGIALHM